MQHEGIAMNYSKTRLQHGYANQILTIDVTSRTSATPALDPQVRDYFLGGRGLGLYLLHRAVSARTQAGDPENPLILANDGATPGPASLFRKAGLDIPTKQLPAPAK